MSGVIPEMFIGEKLSGPADAGLDLVKDKERAGLVTDCTNGL